MASRRGPKSPPTINDIADAAQVSKSTVSLVLKHSPLIKPETAAKVWQAANQLGYVYNRSAASLRQKTSNIIGLVIQDLKNPFFVELLVGAEKVLLESGYITFMAHTSERQDIQDKVLISMREHNAAGLILCPAFDTPHTLPGTIRSWGIPLVVTMRPLGEGDYDMVGCDNVAGMQAATRHLIECGHKRIAFMGRRRGSTVSEQRIAGYLNAMKEARLPVSDDWIVDVPLNASGGRQGVSIINAMSPSPTAVVCYNDSVAFGVLNELDTLGKRAGRDLAVVGFDDIAAAAHSSPPLTSVSVGPAQLGEMASRILLSRINGEGDADKAKKYFVTPRLVVRESSGPMRVQG